MVDVDGIGYARKEIRKLTDRNFGLLPLITSLSPTSGSLAGGTRLTIQVNKPV